MHCNWNTPSFLMISHTPPDTSTSFYHCIIQLRQYTSSKTGRCFQWLLVFFCSRTEIGTFVISYQSLLIKKNPDPSTPSLHCVAVIDAIKKWKMVSMVICIFFTHHNWHIHPFLPICAHENNLPDPSTSSLHYVAETDATVKTDFFFNGYLYFPNSSHIFQPVRRPYAHFRSKKNPKMF